MIKKLRKFILNNLLAVLIIITLLAVLVIAATKMLFGKPKYVFAKVKVAQGLWWASTSKPQLWMVQPLKPGLKQNDILGRPKAELISFTYYPWQQLPAIQYDTYMILKLKVTENGKTGGYKYDRGSIAVGSAIDLEFPTISLSGTVMELSPNPIKDVFETKVVYLSKFNSRPWEYDNIKIGDKFFDGQGVAFEVLDKSAQDVSFFNLGAGVDTGRPVVEPRVDISIKANVKVKKVGNIYIYGEEQPLVSGKELFFVIPSSILNGYQVTSIDND